MRQNGRVSSVVIVGGGPAGYEAALVARQLGAEVTLITREGLGGSAVLTDVVPSKGLIAVAEVLTRAAESTALGIVLSGAPKPDLQAVNARLLRLAAQQSSDIEQRLVSEGVQLVRASAELDGDSVIAAGQRYSADAVLIATGAQPRVLQSAQPDGERILTWKQLYSLAELPEHLIVVGSGVTGAEFASAYHALGSAVTLISSRGRVLPSEDADAAAVLESVFARRGIEVVANARAVSATRTDTGVSVQLQDGRAVVGSHCLMAVGAVPNTSDLGLAAAEVQVDAAGFIQVDRVSRTSRRGVYAAGDCTGGMMLASTAAMQGRTAMRHALGDAVAPLDAGNVSAAVFTNPEIATVGVTQAQVDSGSVAAHVVMQPLATNPRAKMQQLADGFVKLFCQPGSRAIIGGVVVGPNASELIHSVSIAVSQRIAVDDFAAAFTVYPSISGSVAEAARRLRST